MTAFIFAAVMVHAQLVYISQQSMRDWYNSNAPGSVDVAGYLDTTHPELADIDFVSIPVNGTITTVEGLAYLPNLVFLSMNSNGACVPFTVDGWPPSLLGLALDDCGAELLPSWPPSLELLVTNTSFAQFQLPLPASLRALWISFNNEMVSFPVLPAGLESLVVEGLELVTDLGPLPANLRRLEVRECESLGSLPSLPSGLDTLHLDDLPALTAVPTCPSGVVELVASSGLWQAWTEWPDSLRALYITQDWTAEAIAGLPYPGLCIPPLPGQMEIFNVYIAPGSYGMPVCLPNYPSSLGTAVYEFLLSACLVPQVPIYPCGAPDPNCLSSSAQVKGVAFNDANGDGLLNGGEALIAGSVVSIEPGGLLTSTDQSGVYSAFPGVGSFTVTGIPATYWTVTTLPQTADLLVTGATDSLDAIGHLATPGMYDLRVDLSCTGSIPGGISHCSCVVTNAGTESQTAVISVTMDADQTVASVDPAALTQNGNELTWDMPTLQPGATWTAEVDLNTPTSTPINTALEHTATVSPGFPDLTIANNTTAWEGVVMASVDPNDKMALPTSLSPEEVSAGARVEYTVRFQNTGTAPAQRVVINDTLSSDLQWTSMELVASSHPHTWTIQNGVLYIVFDNIDLPDSNSNEAESHGFVRFSMRAATDLMPGESVGNTANIYFDYNEPVITNEAVFSVETNVGAQDKAADALIIWPNPVGDQLMMQGATVGSQVELVDITGRILLRSRTTADRTTLDTKGLVAGAYTLRMMYEGRSSMRSFVKR